MYGSYLLCFMKSYMSVISCVIDVFSAYNFNDLSVCLMHQLSQSLLKLNTYISRHMHALVFLIRYIDWNVIYFK
jgi:hypothetical protein